MAREDTVIQGRLFWQCRRGVRELELLLEAFLATGGHERLDAAGRAALGELLACDDALLLDYLMGSLVPADPRIAEVVDRIRSAASASA